jgi:hypothetical protein
MTPIKLPKPCQCGEWVGMLAPSRQVVCANCNVVRTTLSERVCSFIAATSKHFGEPSEPVVCRKRSTAA